MDRPIGHLRSPLDRLFSRRSHLAILRALQDGREGMSGRAIARAAGVNHQACALALRDLESLGLLQRQGGGHTQLIRLNFESYLVQEMVLPLLRKERELLAHVRRDVANAFKDQALTITLFGSVARAEEAPGSDLDVLILSDTAGKRSLLEKAGHYCTEFRGKYGLSLSPIVMTLPEAARKLRKGDGLLTNILAEGIDLLPHRLAEALP